MFGWFKKSKKLPFFMWDAAITSKEQYDLSEVGVDVAIKHIGGKYNLLDKMSDVHLIVGSGDAIIAGRIAGKMGMGSVVVLPDAVLKTYAWCLLTPLGCFYSEGA